MVALTIISAIASIIGASVSCASACRSGKHRSESERIKNQLIDRRETSELSKLQASCRKALNSMKKYGHSSTLSNLAGTDPAKDSAKVQDFAAMIKEHRSLFGNKTPNEADRIHKELLRHVEDFVNLPDAESRQEHGKHINILLSTIAASIKDLLDNKRGTFH